MFVTLGTYLFSVPSILFSGDCSENHVATVASIYDQFPDPERKNPVSIPINKMRLDSRIMEVEVASIPKADNNKILHQCKPDLKLLVRRPLRMTFELKSGRDTSKSIKDGNRKLQFHGQPEDNEIKSKFCAIWNPNIGQLGAWDTENVKMIWSDETVAECTSTQFGTFGIISEIYEPPSVLPDSKWLFITKMVGYGISILLLATFAITVLVSKHLWEMFHILSMNFALALLLGTWPMSSFLRYIVYM